MNPAPIFEGQRYEVNRVIQDASILFNLALVAVVRGWEFRMGPRCDDAYIKAMAGDGKPDVGWPSFVSFSRLDPKQVSRTGRHLGFLKDEVTNHVVAQSPFPRNAS